MTRLRRSCGDAPGIRRHRRGRGFSYAWDDGTVVQDPDVLARIRALAIPPAWKEVWICPWANGHLQARGTDAAGRLQYRYHDAWRIRRDAEKFERMLEFGRRLDGLRDAVERDLDDRDPSRERVLAAATRLLDVASLRVGGAEYAQDHETYGLASLLKSHATVSGGTIRLRFTAKTGRLVRAEVADGDVASLLRTLKRRRSGGDGLFAWRTEAAWRPMHSDDVNEYLKAALGDEFSAKDFRTWNATVRCAVELAAAGPPPASLRLRRQRVAEAVEAVADHLSNTTTVCRRSYVDPRVIEAYLEGSVIEAVGSDAASRRDAEAAILELCEAQSR